MTQIRHGLTRIYTDSRRELSMMSPEFAGFFLTRPLWHSTISAAAMDCVFRTVEHIG
jgi:hypothetical protein